MFVYELGGEYAARVHNLRTFDAVRIKPASFGQGVHSRLAPHRRAASAGSVRPAASCESACGAGCGAARSSCKLMPPCASSRQVSRDIVQRWVYPFCPDSKFARGVNPPAAYTYNRRNVYKEDGVRASNPSTALCRLLSSRLAGVPHLRQRQQ